jgi:ABC-type lipoprotein release transport system permease subunit
MLRWALKSLIAKPVQLLSSAGGVAFALLLVVLFEAVFAGESDQIVAYPENAAPDVWVMQRGVSNMHMAISLVKDWKIDAVAKVEGVAEVTPILYLNTVIVAGEREWFSFIVGLPTDGARAGPWAMAEGGSMPDLGQAVIPDMLAQMSNVGLGDEITIADRNLLVSGLSAGTYSMANSVVFVTESDLADLISASDLVSYLLIDVEAGASPSVVAERIRAEVDRVNAVVSSEFVANDYAMAMQMGLEMITLMTVIGGALAILVVAFSVYSQMSRQRRELAIARAIGVRPAKLFAAAALQAVCIGVLGVLLAVALSWLIVPLLSVLVPQLTLHITPESIARVSFVALVAAVIAALSSVRGLLRVDPVSALNG